ncbi:MAG: hypothetical protein JKY80_09385 [Mariprofundaceae bacterium]|nr:hypothetical protein [Mariprofundaceae bacterium]
METKHYAKSRITSHTALTKPISIRFTKEEIAELKRQAGKISLSEYVRRRLFMDGAITEFADHIESRPTPQMRQKLLAQILMRLGKLDMVHNVNTLMNGLQYGLIETSPELCAALEAVHRELKALRHDLLKALGLRP